MTFKDDINARIRIDFGEQSHKAMTMLIDAIDANNVLRSDRVIRCIVFLAKGDLRVLNRYIETATDDPRDIMLLAEYEESKEDENPKRVIDFNNTFEQCSLDAKEQT